MIALLYVLFPNGEQVLLLGEFPSVYDCESAIVEWADQELLEEGYSFHCYETDTPAVSSEPNIRP